jgi:hypothetical protein
MLKYADDYQYTSDSVKKIKADLELLRKNINIFNMPNTPEFLEGYKFMLLANTAFDYFEPVLSKKADDYLFDANENFLLYSFYDFKNYLIKNYLNIIAKDYDTTSSFKISSVFEEKDKRSVSSKERNKINHQLHNKKMKHLCIDDLYRHDKFDFELESKSMVVEIKGINMQKMDYSEIDTSLASHALRIYLKNNISTFKRSTNKVGLDSIPQNSLLVFDKSHQEQMMLEEDPEKLLTSLCQTDFELLCQLEFWLLEQNAAIDAEYFFFSPEMTPVSIKTQFAESVLKPVCLVSGYPQSDLGSLTNQSLPTSPPWFSVISVESTS